MKNKTMLFVLAALSVSVEAADLVLPEALIVGWTDGPDALAQMSYCVPGLTADKVEDIQKRSVNRILVQYQRTPEKSAYLIVQGDKFACVDRNGNGKPMLPAKTFGKALRLDGASQQTTDALHRNLATQIATRGTADALVKFSNGNALELTYSVVEDAPAEILYSTNFLKAGEFDETKYRFVVSDQIKSFATTSYGTAGRRAIGILQDELAPRPLKGDHLLAKGNRQTADYAFEGSSWRFNTGSAISLAGDGVLSFNPSKGEASSGSWRVEDGALYLNYGKVYGSAILDPDNKLLVDFRSPPANTDKGERRWTARLERN